MTCDFLLTEQYFNVFYVHDVAGFEHCSIDSSPIIQLKVAEGQHDTAWRFQLFSGHLHLTHIFVKADPPNHHFWMIFRMCT